MKKLFGSKPSEVSGLQKDIEQLSNYEAFARVLECIRRMREDRITELHDVGTDRLQQISGRILAYDDILAMCQAENVLQRHRVML